MTHAAAAIVGPCRVCGAEDWYTFLDLGEVPPANAFTDGATPVPKFPLTLMSCRSCRLMSLTHVVDRTDLYEHYFYVSSPSRLIHRHMDELAQRLRDRLKLDRDSLVVELGSNNGDMLARFDDAGCRVLGVDPAHNIAEQARARGIDTRTDFFGVDVAARIRDEQGRADLVLARHVFAHIDDLDDVVRGVGELLAPEGLFVLEVPYLVELMDRRAFDTVYHEHLSYFLIGTLRRLFERFGMVLVDVTEHDLHGGSIVVSVAHAGSSHEIDTRAVDDRIRAERIAGLHRDETYDRFADDVNGLRRALAEQVCELVAEGATVAGYGASAKGVTLLTTSNIPPGALQFCSDTTPEKQGTQIPGLGVPVVSPAEADRRDPDVYVLLAWNYRDEILEKEQDYLERGGRFLVPVPEPVLIGAPERAAPIGGRR